MLRRIVGKYGNDLGGNARRCEGLLKDLCGAYRREISVLTNAIEERIPLDLLAAGNSMPRELLLTRLAKRLEDNLGLTIEASRWAVDSWALALGVLTDDEVKARERKQNIRAPQIPPTPVQPLPQKPKIQQPTQNRQTQPKPQPQPPKIYPPIMRTPANVPLPAPIQPVQRSGSNVNVQQNLPQNLPHNSAAVNPVPKKRSRKFLGCFFVFFLLIATGFVLLFGVPYAIEVMRETQRQNEPPRF